MLKPVQHDNAKNTIRPTMRVSLLITILGWLLASIFLYSLWQLDASQTPLEPEPSSSGPVILLSYADGEPVFLKNQMMLASSAANKGVDIIYNYHRRDIDPTFYRQHRAILDQKRGDGYWLWKPYFILKTMRSAPANAIIIYADSSMVLTKPLAPLLALLTTEDMIIGAHRDDPMPQKFQLKMEARNVFSRPLTQEILDFPDIGASFIMLKNTPKNQAFIQRWLTLCTNADALTDTPLDPAKQEHLIFHKHDQSLLNVLVAMDPQGKRVIRKTPLRQYGVINYHRHADRADRSPLLLVAGFPNWFAHYLWNNGLFQALRAL